MLALSNTENLTGVRISGDYWDFNELKQAIEKVISVYPSIEDNIDGIQMLLLDFCSKLTVTKLGQANIETTFNGITAKVQDSYAIEFPFENIYFSTEFFWPELFFSLICLDYFIEQAHTTNKHQLTASYILTLRKFQVNTLQCLNTLYGPKVKNQIEEMFFKKSVRLHNYPIQYIDLLNVNYTALTRDEKEKSLPKILQKICFEDREFLFFKNKLQSIANSSNASLHTVILEFDYPSTIIW